MSSKLKDQVVLSGDYTAPFAPGTFLWALDQMMEGKKVRRSYWPVGGGRHE